MKTVKFKDLPENVREFLQREYAFAFLLSDSIELDWLHKMNEWSKATDEERLSYAEWRYKDGTKFVLHNGYMVEVTEGAITTTYLPKPIETVIYAPALGSPSSNSHEMIYNGAKWAEIIEEKEKPVYDEALIRSYEWKCDSPISESAEFKAGDEVVTLTTDYPNKYKVIHQHLNLLWLEQELEDDFIIHIDQVRKADKDPDKVYRETAKEFLREKVYSFENLEQFMMLKQNLIELTTEAIKKGKEL